MAYRSTFDSCNMIYKVEAVKLARKSNHTRNDEVSKKVRPEPRQVKSSWYNNPKLSDITIKYGEHGEKQFDGHRFVLANSSEWFMNASSHSEFRESTSRVITLKEDHPDGLDGLFEFCYTGNYTQTKDFDSRLDGTKKVFMQHARVFVTADKYMAYDLVELAFGRLESRVVSEARYNSQAFFAFALEQLYLYDNLFGHDHQSTIEDVEEDAVEEDFDKREVGEEDAGEEDAIDPIAANLEAAITRVLKKVALEKKNERLQKLEQQSPRWTLGMRHDSLSYAHTGKKPEPQVIEPDRQPASHPLDRLRAMIVDAALGIVVRNHDEFNAWTLAEMVRRYPDFVEKFRTALRRFARRGYWKEYMW